MQKAYREENPQSNQEAAPVEFGAKLDLRLDEKGMARIEKMSFDAYNESNVLVSAVQRYFERTGHYPEHVLVDKIYRNRANLQFCKEHGIHLSGPALGRPHKNAKTDKKTEYADIYTKYSQKGSSELVSMH